MRSRTGRVIVGLAAGVLGLAATGYTAAPGTLSGSLIGFVSDQGGVPQMGAAISLFNQYDRLVNRTITNERGSFGFESLAPGLYSVRVTLASFVPALKHDVRVQPGMRAFLSINLASVLSSIELVYSTPGSASIMSDDWKWVLRTATSTRPVLRILPDVDISDRTLDRESKRLVFTDTQGMLRVSAGDNGELSSSGAQADLGTAFALATSVFGGNRVQFAGNLGYASNAGMPAAGFRTSYSRADAAGVAPEVNVTMRQLFLPMRVGGAVLTGGESAPALKTLSVSSLDRRRVGENMLLEYGASIESVTFVHRLNYLSPYARATVEMGDLGDFQLAFSSGMPPAELLGSAGAPETEMSHDIAILSVFPRVSLMDSMAQVQRTENFELAYRKALGSRTFTASAYHESVSNAAFLMAAPGGYYSSADLLPDLSTDGSIFNMGRYRRTGLMASVTQKVGGDLSVALAGGNAGVLTPGIRSLTTDDPNELRGLMGSGRRNWVAARITGLAPLTGTRFSAAYQWSDYRTISPTHLYLTQGFQPALGLNLQLRQPLPTFGIWSGRIEASAELRNLLAQGYVPVSTYDGRTLYFLQNPRAVRGGLSFIF